MTDFRFPSFSTIRQTALMGFLLVMGGLVTCPAQQTAPREIKVPYALGWGDGIDKVREMINAVKARETGSSEKVPGKVVIEAVGLNVGDLLLKKSLFTFRNGLLAEVELQYADASWDGDKAVDFFDRTRRRIDERYGAGALMVNKVKETPAGENIPKDATYTLIIYNWTQPACALELNFYTMEEKEKAFRLVSLRYKAP